MWFLIVLLAVISIVFGTSLVRNPDTDLYSFIRMASYFLFYIVVTHRIIKQVWVAKRVNNNVIFGLISGYVSLGLIGFFICISIEMANPESFQGFLITNSNSLTDDLLYFSYITLLTIGYGDIMPITPLAQKATILIGLIGQIYLVIISAVVVGKYINQNTQNND
ncbi:potassium channel family protein [uncultured Flavobacterium sp.]|uniref:potassium channel family protein n=1 Tax=uncultured Flavobacterium sp. TaxID=165435 RepID=UPI0025EDFA9B|nr:potassium channel family protein [uncultured Flavobacterium sp.]